MDVEEKRRERWAVAGVDIPPPPLVVDIPPPPLVVRDQDVIRGKKRREGIPFLQSKETFGFQLIQDCLSAQLSTESVSSEKRVSWVDLEN